MRKKLLYVLGGFLVTLLLVSTCLFLIAVSRIGSRDTVEKNNSDILQSFSAEYRDISCGESSGVFDGHIQRSARSGVCESKVALMIKDFGDNRAVKRYAALSAWIAGAGLVAETEKMFAMKAGELISNGQFPSESGWIKEGRLFRKYRQRLLRLGTQQAAFSAIDNPWIVAKMKSSELLDDMSDGLTAIVEPIMEHFYGPAGFPYQGGAQF